MHRSGPRPNTDAIQCLGVDRHEHDVAGGHPGGVGKAPVGQGGAKRANRPSEASIARRIPTKMCVCHRSLEMMGQEREGSATSSCHCHCRSRFRFHFRAHCHCRSLSISISISEPISIADSVAPFLSPRHSRLHRHFRHCCCFRRRSRCHCHCHPRSGHHSGFKSNCSSPYQPQVGHRARQATSGGADIEVHSTDRLGDAHPVAAQLGHRQLPGQALRPPVT